MLVSGGVELISFTGAEHRIDGIEMFVLLLSRAYTEARLFLGGNTARTGGPN